MHHIAIVSAKQNLVVEEKINIALKRCIQATLEHEHMEHNCDIYVMLTDNDGIQALNNEHRGIDRPTDVLSFPMQELIPGEHFEPSPLELDPETGALMLGDLVISIPKAEEQAKEYEHTLMREMCFLAVHGTLHLLGYDHEKSEDDERIHFALQDEILHALDIRREQV